MWPFLFILAIVPLLFFWSDSVLELFPQLHPYLPGKESAKQLGLPGTTPEAGTGAQLGAPGRWTEVTSKDGYVAFLLSADGQYRLAVGCRSGSQATLQVTQLSGQPVAPALTLNYQYGKLPLQSGVYVGPDLVGAVAQYSDIYLQAPATDVVAQFQASAADSGIIARSLDQACPAVSLTSIEG